MRVWFFVNFIALFSEMPSHQHLILFFLLSLKLWYQFVVSLCRDYKISFLAITRLLILSIDDTGPGVSPVG